METPTWLDKTMIRVTLDARPLLESGQHPLQSVIEGSSVLKPGEIYEIITPFPPVPMVEKMTALNFRDFTQRTNDGMFHTYFQKL